MGYKGCRVKGFMISVVYDFLVNRICEKEIKV